MLFLQTGLIFGGQTFSILIFLRGGAGCQNEYFCDMEIFVDILWGGGGGGLN